MNRFAPLFISVTLLMVAGSLKAQETTAPAAGNQFPDPMVQIRALTNDSGEQAETDAVMGPTNNNDNSKIGTTEIENTALVTRVKLLEEQLEDLHREKTANWFGLPIKLLLAGGTGLIGFTALIIAVTSRRNTSARRRSTQKPPAKNSKVIIDSNLKPYDDKIKALENEYKKLREDLEHINDRMKSSASMSNLKTMAVITPEQYQKVQPSPAVISTPQRQANTGPIKQDLITSLNEGDQKKLLRNAFSSELNITKESEDDIFTGRAIGTKLEVVSGGGSYLLVVLQGQSWLFPTIQSLNGFTAVERSKGLFDYEKQATLSSPQLLEPALLERSGDMWMIKEIGKIAIP